MRTYLTGGTVYTPDQAIDNGVVVVEDGKILEVGPASRERANGRRLDVTGLKVVPGLIDLHLHGLEGSDVMAGASHRIAERAVSSGVTSFLATAMADSIEDLREVIHDIVRCDGKGAEILGVHLEGPYLSPLQHGMMVASKFRPFSWSELEELIQTREGAVKMVTLAPELEGAVDGIRRLRRAGVVASVGHSNATFAKMTEAVAAGLSHATHAFNAMRGFHHREPGTVGAVLHYPQIVAQFIADGQHLHPATIELLVKAKGVDGLALISDATPLAGLPAGEYQWMGMTIKVGDGKAQVEGDGGLGGSIRMMNYGLRYLTKVVGLSVQDALTTATKTPARALRLSQRKGRLTAGYDADIAVFDDEFECRLAMVKGNVVYRATRM